MNVDFDHWHIVITKIEMIEKALEILTRCDRNHESVMPYSIYHSAKSVVQLFINNFSHTFNK